MHSNRIAEKIKQYLSGCVPVDEKYGAYQAGEEEKRKRNKEKKKEEEQTKTNKEGFEVTMSVEIITFKKLGFFSVYLASFSSQVPLYTSNAPT